jgi:uncharacterized membrane protein
MVLAEIGSTGYNIVLVLHIVLAVAGFGGLFIAPMLRRTDGSQASVAGIVLGYTQRVALPAVAVAGVLGFGLVSMAKDGSFEVFKFSQTWVSLAIVLWLAELAVLWFGVAATERKVVAGDAAAEARLPMFTGISHLILLVVVYLMVFKPGF